MKRLLITMMLALPLGTFAATENKQKNAEKEAVATTTFQGTIGDVSNYKPVDDVTLTVISSDNTVKKVVKTDNQGKFIVENIPAGIYKVKFEKDGYEPGKYQSLTLREGQANNFGFVLFKD